MLNQGALTLANITWLLAAMAFVIAPHVTRLPIWVSAVCVGAGLARWWIARRGLRTPPWWIMAMLAVAVAAGALVEYRQLIGREVGVTLLIAMLCLKVLEMRMKRDVVIAIFLGFFLAMTNFLYSQTILMGLYMLACVWIFVATLVGFNRINTEATVRERLVPAFWLLIQAIPLMLVLFFLFRGYPARCGACRALIRQAAVCPMKCHPAISASSRCRMRWHFAWTSKRRYRKRRICIGAGRCSAGRLAARGKCIRSVPRRAFNTMRCRPPSNTA